MNIIGERLQVLASADRTKKGRSGRVLLETAKTLIIDSTEGGIRVEKSGAAFLFLDSGKVVSGSDLVGRLEDRLRRPSG